MISRNAGLNAHRSPTGSGRRRVVRLGSVTAQKRRDLVEHLLLVGDHPSVGRGQLVGERQDALAVLAEKSEVGRRQGLLTGEPTLDLLDLRVSEPRGVRESEDAVGLGALDAVVGPGHLKQELQGLGGEGRMLL